MLSYENCNFCPRRCGVNRAAGEVGFCGQTDTMRIGAAALHFGEEPPLTGEGGSGTIFFCGCTMGCPFCQNWQVSRSHKGADVSLEALVQIMLEIQNRGGENINFVTGTQFIPSIRVAVEMARNKGLSLPLVWNCSGYETLEAIEVLNKFIDIYLPDYKASENHLTSRLYKAPDYPEVAELALIKMADSKRLVYSARDVMTQGVIVRHLVLPGELESTRRFLYWYKEQLIDKSLLSLMVQYSPVKIPGNTIKIPDRYINEEEYETLLKWLDELEIEEGFFQDLEKTNDWLPDFNNKIPFPSKQTVPLWSAVTKDFI